jgi:hypothetical protein
MTKQEILKKYNLSEEEFYKKFPTQEDYQKFENGGQLGSTIGSIAGMGLGSMIGIPPPIASMLGGKAVNFVQNQFKMGGNLTEYNGNKHENGGIPIGQAEVEGGETNHQGYIFSDTLKLGKNTFADISKKINNKYSKRPDDKISKESKERELGNLMKVQESTGLTNQGNKMWSGGWANRINRLGNQANDFSNYRPSNYAPTAITESPTGFYTTEDRDSNKKAVGNIANTLVDEPTNKEAIQEAIEDERSRVGLQTTSPTINKSSNPPSTPPNAPNGGKPLQTSVNPLGYLASNVGPLYDIARGLKGGDPVDFERIKPSFMYADPKPAITAMNNTTSTSFNNARNAIRNNASSSGEYLAMMNNLAGSESLKRGLGTAQIKSEYDKMNTNTYNSIANQVKSQNAQIQMNEATARQMETDAARSAVSQGLHNFGQNTLGYGQDRAMNKTQNTMLPLLADGYEYVMDDAGKVSTRRKISNTNKGNQITEVPA